MSGVIKLKRMKDILNYNTKHCVVDLLAQIETKIPQSGFYSTRCFQTKVFENTENIQNIRLVRLHRLHDKNGGKLLK